MIRRRLLPYVRPYYRELVLVLLTMTVSALSGLVVPMASQRMVDALVTGRNRSYLTVLLLMMLAIGVVMMLANLWRAIATERVGQRALVQLRLQLFQHVLGLPVDQLARHGVGQNMSRIMNDTQVVIGALFGTVPQMLIQALRLLAIAAVMLSLDLRLGLVALAVLPVMAVTVSLGSGRLHRASLALREMLGVYSAQLEQALARVKHAQAANLERWEGDRFREHSQSMADTYLKLRYRQAGLEVLLSGITLIWPLFVLWLAAGAVAQGRLTVGQLVAFNMYMAGAFGPVQSLSGAALELQTVRAALDRIEVLTQGVAPAPLQAAPVQQLAESLRLENVWFGYPGREHLLRGISLNLRRGQLCALVGASGAGKSTLLDLAVGFHAPASGRILVDEVDALRFGKTALRQQVALVPQDPPLFAGTLRDNLVWGAPFVTDDELMEAVRVAGLLPLVRKLPGGLNHPVGEKGVTVSAGEKQRIALVRALLRKCPILLLDEPTGNLDVDAEAALWQALVELKRDRAVLVVVHRLVHLHLADQILVLEDGSLREAGSFPELVSAGGTFAGMYRQAIGQ